MIKIFHPLSLLAITLGIGSFMLAISNFNNPEFKATELKCRTDPPENLGIKRLDSFLCIIIPFFQQAISTPEGLLVTNIVLSTAMVVFFIFCIEGIRTRSKGLILFPALFGALGQLFGIGPISLALYVPSYIYSTLSSNLTLSNRSMSLFGLYLCFVVCLLFTAGSILMTTLPNDSKSFQHVNTIFQFAPVIFFFTPIFHFIKPSAPTSTVPVVKGGLLFLGGVSFALYYFYLSNLLVKRGVIEKMTLDTLRNEPEAIFGLFDFTSPAVKFLLVDGLSLFLSTVFILLQDGFISIIDLIGMLFTSILLSPGAAVAIYFAKRESKVLDHNRRHNNHNNRHNNRHNKHDDHNKQDDHDKHDDHHDDQDKDENDQEDQNQDHPQHLEEEQHDQQIIQHDQHDQHDQQIKNKKPNKNNNNTNKNRNSNNKNKNKNKTQ